MAAKSPNTLTMMLMVGMACMAMLVPKGLAQLSPEPELISPSAEEVFAEWLTESIDILQCSSSLVNIEGCVVEIYRSLFSGQIVDVIGSACCKAISEISDDCWSKLFPLNPFFPPLLKTFCVSSGGGAVPAPKGIGASSVTKLFYRENFN